MKKSYTRIIAFLLSVVMCIGLLPVVSFAATGQTFPKIDSLTKSEGAKLEAYRNSNYDRTVTGVEHIEYDKPKEEDGELVVGEEFANLIDGGVLGEHRRPFDGSG